MTFLARVSPRAGFVLLSVVSLGLLAGGLTIGELFNLHPCHLCNFQRFLYLVCAFFALVGAVLTRWRRLWSALAALTAAAGVAAAVQQSWMQYAPAEAIECGFGDPTLVEQLVNWLGVQWPSMFMVTGFCTNKDWVFLNLSLANWSVLGFVSVFVIALWLLFRR